MFNLSSWTDVKQPIVDWLVGELSTTPYRTPKKVARDWIENDDLLLLLDGLDEVSSEHREACAHAINDFRQNHGWTPLVVCCRSEEYKTLETRLDLKGAISLQPLTKEQIDNYLDQMGQELAALRSAMTDDPVLYELAKTPLMLSIMTLAYRGMSVHDLQPLETADARRKHIFDNYVERMFKPRTHRTILDVSDDPRSEDKRFSKEETIHWLSWLARRMSQHGQTVFLIEKMQPDWLPTLTQQRIMTIGIVIMGVAVIIAVSFGLLFGLCYGMLFGLLFGLGYGKDIRPIETLRFSWSKMRTELVGVKLLVWLLTGMFFGMAFGLLGGPSLWLFFGMISGMIGGEIVARTVPNEGIHRSARCALFFGMFSGMLVWLLAGVPIGRSLGLLFGLLYGGLACIQHLVLRIMLRLNGFAPLNYVRFLDYAADHIFLRKVGGGYIFVHGLLLEYFASLEPEEEGG